MAYTITDIQINQGMYDVVFEFDTEHGTNGKDTQLLTLPIAPPDETNPEANQSQATYITKQVENYIRDFDSESAAKKTDQPTLPDEVKNLIGK